MVYPDPRTRCSRQTNKERWCNACFARTFCGTSINFMLDLDKVVFVCSKNHSQDVFYCIQCVEKQSYFGIACLRFVCFSGWSGLRHR